MVFDRWEFSAFYIFLMVFSFISVILGKLFPNSIGIPLTGFYKRYSTPEIFEKYCGNLFSAVAGGLAEIAQTSGGKVAVAIGGVLIAQDAFCKSGATQVAQYKMEQVMNGGTHPSNQPFLFKPTEPSWADQLVGIGKE
jgi:hypothetical protein